MRVLIFFLLLILAFANSVNADQQYGDMPVCSQNANNSFMELLKEYANEKRKKMVTMYGEQCTSTMVNVLNGITMSDALFNNFCTQAVDFCMNIESNSRKKRTEFMKIYCQVKGIRGGNNQVSFGLGLEECLSHMRIIDGHYINEEQIKCEKTDSIPAFPEIKKADLYVCYLDHKNRFYEVYKCPSITEDLYLSEANKCEEMSFAFYGN